MTFKGGYYLLCFLISSLPVLTPDSIITPASITFLSNNP